MHFYARDKDGKVKPRHFVENKSKGGTRPSRVTDAKKAKASGEVWMPSVTSVLGILDKPALVNWKVDKHLDAAYEEALSFNHPVDCYADLEAYKRKIKAITSEALDSAPKAGTAIHHVLEVCLYEAEDSEGLSAVECEVIANCERLITDAAGHFAFSDLSKEEYCLSEEYGYAGCADLVIRGDENWVIDYKSKQTHEQFKKSKIYPEHTRQLAAYGEELFNGKRFKAANIFICLETGECSFHEHDSEAIVDGWLDFKDCLSIYKRNNYNPFEA